MKDPGLRFYNPSLGRWTSRDPIEEKETAPHLYGFVENDPSEFVDPIGLEKMSEINVEILDYGMYKTLFNYLALAIIQGEHPVKNIDELIVAAKQEVAKCEKKHGSGCCCIKRIRITGHGCAGATAVGAGTGGVEKLKKNKTTKMVEEVTTYPAGEPDYQNQAVSASNIGKLLPLKDLFCKDGEMVFNSCYVAEGKVGKDFLQEVAKTLGVKASGYTGMTDPIFGGSGAYVTACPCP